MKKNFKRLIALGLSAVMMFSLAACGNSKQTDSASGGNSDTQSKQEASGDSTAASGDVVTIKWVAVGNGMPDNYDAWKAHINPYLEEKIGVNIEFEVVAWGDWDNRRSVIVNANEDYDILFTNLNTFTSDVNLGAFADITELVKTASPDLYSYIPEDYWDACSVAGKIYGVPTYKDSSMTQYFVWDKELVDNLGLDVTGLHDLASLEETLVKMKEADGKTPFILHKEGIMAIVQNHYDALGLGLLPMGVKYDDESRKVVNTLEQDVVMNDLKTLHKWYNDGLINSDAATLQEAPKYRPCYVAQGWSGAAKTSWGPQMGVEAMAVQWGDTILANDTVQGSMNCISASSKNPEKALQLLELVNTDSYVRDALYYGLEGDDFDYTEDGKVDKHHEEWAMAGYTQGTYFNVSQRVTDEFNQWEEVKALNENAKPSVMLGFSVDTTAIEDQLANCIEVWNRYKMELLTGVADPETTVPALMEELRSAGYDEMVTEIQAQIDAAYN